MSKPDARDLPPRGSKVQGNFKFPILGAIVVSLGVVLAIFTAAGDAAASPTLVPNGSEVGSAGSRDVRIARRTATPTAAVLAASISTATPTRTNTPRATATRTATATPTRTNTATAIRTSTSTPTRTATPTPTNAISATATAIGTSTAPIQTKFFITRNGSNLSVPLFTSQVISTQDLRIQRAVIVIHGASLNAADYWRYAAEATQGVSGMVVVAPLFAEIGSPLTSDQLYWTTHWRDGDPSELSGRPWQISSFEVMDELLATLSRSYPNLTTISIAGHSGGGQFVQRYAATRNDARIEYLISAPSTFMYLDAIRPGPTCSWYNQYKYGLEDLADTPYMAALGAVTLKENYRKAKMKYIVGDADNDPNDSSLDTNCQAMSQGSQRLMRSQEFYASLGRVYGTSIYANHTFAIVPGIGHQASKMLTSEPARALLRR